MSRVRGRNTKPEMRVRSLLHRRGYRFRLHHGDLPGSPDIVLRKHRAVIFVHGCFWHRHPGCERASSPTANAEYWQAKFERNVRRDAEAIRKLEEAGWWVLVIWECELKGDMARAVRKIEGMLADKV